MEEALVPAYKVIICAMYRLAQIDRAEYLEQVVHIVHELLVAAGIGDFPLLERVYDYRKWLAYPPYIKMMAFADMYLNEFLNHPYAQARVATISSRFKDCSVLVSTRFLTKSLGLRFDAFARWIWTRAVADQFCRVIRGGEEVDNVRSYAMYFMDLGLSPKSPYSASVIPDLHMFCHTIRVSMAV